MKRVKKIWGEELWVTNTKKYCGKILSLKKDFFCSLHKHKKKDETFYILSGEVVMEIDDKQWIMGPGDSLHIEPNHCHRFTGLTNAEIIEFSTYHLESDSYRKELSGKI